MSRIGKKPITLPKGVSVTIQPNVVEVQGPKGKLQQACPPGVTFEMADGQLLAKTTSDKPELGKYHEIGRAHV